MVPRFPQKSQKSQALLEITVQMYQQEERREMTQTAWEKGFLMPELPAKQPWERCLYCSSFDLWQGTLAVCCKRRMVLSPKAHYDRRCNSWAPNDYCKRKPD